MTLPFGSYIYADYGTGEILLWNNNQQTLLLDTSRLISSYGEDEAGEFYVAGLSSGTVEKIARVNVTVSGRVFTPDGRGLPNATVLMTDPQNVTRRVTTSSFGFYSFDTVQTLQTYTMRVKSKQYLFQSQQVPVSLQTGSIDFTGME